MKRTLSIITILMLLLFFVDMGVAQTKDYPRVGLMTAYRFIRTVGGAPFINGGYYDQTYAGNAEDAFKLNYTGSGNNILTLSADGTPVVTLTKAGALAHTGTLDVLGHMALGEVDPVANIIFDMKETYTNTTDFVYGLRNDVRINPGSSSSVTGLANWTNISIESGNTADHTGTYYGNLYQALHQGEGTVAGLQGSYSSAWNQDIGTITLAIGARGVSFNEEGDIDDSIGVRGEVRQRHASGTTTRGYSFKTRIDNYAGEITDAYGYYFTDPEASATVGTLYGMYLETPTKGTTNYSIYSAGGDNYFGGQMEIVGQTVYTPSTAQVIDAVGDAVLANATMTTLNPNGDYTLTSIPTIADGEAGQIVYVTCANGEANTVTVQDQGTLGGSNLQLGAATRAVSGKDCLVLLFDGADWIEISYANNN